MSLKIKIDYKGKWPSLCLSDLKVIISGSEIERANREWDFGHCLSSRGQAWTRSDYTGTTQGPWSISYWPDNFPKELQLTVLQAVNAEMPWECCGGYI